jgi:hypothetical protein
MGIMTDTRTYDPNLIDHPLSPLIAEYAASILCRSWGVSAEESRKREIEAYEALNTALKELK